MTRAPKSDNIKPRNGAGAKPTNSTTFTPFNGAVILMNKFC